MLKKTIQFIKNTIPLKIRDFLYYKIACLLITPPYLNQQPSFSQAGEDRILMFLFTDRNLDLSKIKYLDIGARHPTNGSNTFLLYTLGSRGVCVEADRGVIPLIKELRPRDKVLNVGVSNKRKVSGNFYFLDGGESTLSKEELGNRKDKNSLKKADVIKIPLIDINTLIKKSFKTYPVFLSIDIEGMDFPVLKSLNFKKYPIPVICVETCLYSNNYIRPKNKGIVEFLVSKGYEVYADTYINTILVNKKWFNNK